MELLTTTTTTRCSLPTDEGGTAFSFASQYTLLSITKRTPSKPRGTKPVLWVKAPLIKPTLYILCRLDLDALGAAHPSDF